MNKTSLTITVSAALLLVGCSTPAKLFLETDMGNDIEDAMALQMSLRYIDLKKADLLAVCVNKEGLAPVQYVDFMNSWNGHPEVPVGKITNGAFCSNDADFSRETMAMKDASGTPIYLSSVKRLDDVPESVELYRKILSDQPNHSVVIASVGFSTNLLRLMCTGPDQYSKLSGAELVMKKVKKLVIMAGDFNNHKHAEYNVRRDIPSAKYILEQWPTPVDIIPYKIGDQVHFPIATIDNGFPWQPKNIIVDGFNIYRKYRNHDSPMWDTPSVVLAVEGDKWYTMSPVGKVTVDSKGHTFFTEDKTGNRRIAALTDEQARALQEHIIKEVTTRPATWAK